MAIGLGVYNDTLIIFGRLASVFNLKNQSMIAIGENNSRGRPFFDTRKGDIVFHQFSSYWTKEIVKPTLTSINFHFQSGKLYGITGKVGSGKSSFLAAILGEMPFYSGKFETRGSVAYVEQEPIVFSDTVQNNILFGRSLNSIAYQQVI